MHEMDLDLARIAQAQSLIDPLFVNTPQFVDEQLCAALGRRVLTKIETFEPVTQLQRSRS